MNGEQNTFLDALSYVKVALDVDSTMAQIVPLIRDEEKIRGGNEELGRGEFLQIYRHIWQNRHKEIGVIVDRELLVTAGKTYHIDIATSRGDDTMPALLIWLSENNISGYKGIIHGPGMDKLSLYTHNVLIDDDPSLAKRVAKTENRFIFMPDMFNNKEVSETNNVMRVSDVNEALRVLLRKADENGRAR